MARRTRKNVGVIGLGIIGSRVADNLRRQGYHVFVWNRNPRPIPNFVGAPSELAEMCDYIQIFVSDDDALLDVVRQMVPALSPRHIVIAHPTVAPHSMRTAADLVERRGARFVEAPFTGSKMGAEKGELVFYVAGDEDRKPTRFVASSRARGHNRGARSTPRAGTARLCRGGFLGHRPKIFSGSCFSNGRTRPRAFRKATAHRTCGDNFEHGGSRRRG